MQQRYRQRDVSPSKIPRPLGKDFTKYRPSKLDLMKEEYQRKIMREREQKIIEIYENNQRKALERVSRHSSPEKHSRNSVRSFFEEARAIGASGNMNAIQQHYRKGGVRRASDPIMDDNKPLTKRSAGKDRQYPLAPIQNRTTPDEDVILTKPQRARHLSNKGPNLQNRENKSSAPKSYSAPSSNKNTPKHIDVSDTSPLSDDVVSPTSSESNSPPNSAHLQNLKRKNSLNSREMQPGIPIESQEKLTDFQKWQLEQVRAREERLHKHRNKNKMANSEKYESDEGIDSDNQALVEEEILKKQQELMSKIEQQQHELDRIKREKDQQQEVERREFEKRQQKATIEREKQEKLEKQKQERKQQQEEKRRKQQEEQRQAREEEEERRREDRERRAQEEEDRDRNRTYRHDSQDSSEDQIIPHPPATKKPTRRPPPRRATPPQNVEELEPVEGPNVDFYIQAAEEASGSQSVRLAECRVCGRKFAAERLQKHESCCKNASKKRKVFDPVKMRIQGTESAQFQSTILAEKKSPAKKAKKKDWRKQHDEFINAIRYAKKVTELESKGGDVRDLTPPPPAENPDYVPCPHCGRKFNSGAADRHIPRCRDIKGKPAPTRRR